MHVVSTEKDAFDRGYVLGGRVRQLVDRNLEIYMKRFHSDGLTRHAVLRLARKIKPFIEKYDEEMFLEMQGVSKATGHRLEEILALNARYELVWGSLAGGCTSIAVQPEAAKRGHVLVGQNWDWISSIRDSCHTWRIRRSGMPDLLCFTEAGIVGPKIGMNSAGLSLTVNGLASAKDGIRTGVPFHLICRRILNSTSMNDAVTFISEVQRAGSANYLIGHADGEFLDVEAGPDQLGYMYPDGGTLVHTNHFVSLDVDDTVRKKYPDTIVRYNRCRRLLLQRNQGISTNDLQAILRDHFNHPNSICYHSDERQPIERRDQTNASFVMNLTAGVMLVAKGTPCKNDYEKLSLKE